jgi:hypothetical protein
MRLLVGSVLASVLVAVPSGGASAGSLASHEQADSTQQEVAQAFRALAALPAPSRGATTLQGYDGAMRMALQEAGTQLLDGDNGRPATVSDSTGTATIVRPGQATVPLTITVHIDAPPPSYSLHYTAVALETRGRWQVSWTTMCLLVELARELCPPTPRHVEAGDVLPSQVATTSFAPGLVNPGPLAIAPDGGVLIADLARDQILEWKDGLLTVVAGDGLSGFAGDGGPAVDAELNDPGEIAVGPNGTIYFVDSGNDRVRAVSPGGVIETVAGDGSLVLGADVGDGGPATAASLNPTGVAVNRDGDLFISSNSDIREVSPAGVISTFVRGGPPYGVDVQAGGTSTAFFPDSLSLDGEGDLIGFSFSPKVLFSISPSGQVTQLAVNYATALSEAPDGSVLVAEHNPGLERVNGDAVATLPLDTQVPGLRNALVAEGIAEAPGGALYVDSEPGDGFTDQTGLYEISNGVAHPVEMSSSLASTLPALGAPGFPASTFPATIPSTQTGAALSSCPSMTSVVPFTRAAENTALQLLGFWNTSFSYNLHASDRAWWPGVVENFTGTSVVGRQSVGPVAPASGGLYAPAIEAACGRTLVQDSIQVVMEPSAYDFSYQHVYLLDRGGTPIVYFAAQ